VLLEVYRTVIILSKWAKCAYRRNKDLPVVEFKVFDQRSHGMVNQDGWKEVADYAIAFAER
jgi:hypothetical protein